MTVTAGGTAIGPGEPTLSTDARDPGLDELYRRYGRRLQAICRAYLHDATAVEDAVQEVFLRAGTRLEARRGGSAKAYLDGMARNVCLEELRRRRRATVARRAEGSDLLEPEDIALDRRSIENLWAQLSLRDRVLIVHRFAGYSQREIAARLQTSVHAVEVGLVRARRRARQLLDTLPVMALLSRMRRRDRLQCRSRAAALHRRRTAMRLARPGRIGLSLMVMVPAAAILVAGQRGWGPLSPGAATMVDAHDVAAPALVAAAPAADVHIVEVSTPTRGVIYASGDRIGCAAATCAVLYRSSDGGRRWTSLPARGFAGGRIVAAPRIRTQATLLAAGPAGLQRSDDGGADFHTVAATAGAAAALPGATHPAVVVAAPHRLEVYDVRSGRLTDASPLPAGAGAVDLVARSDGAVVVSVRLAAPQGSSGSSAYALMDCALHGACTTVLTDTHATSLRLRASSGGDAIAAFSEHRLYVAHGGGPFTATRDVGSGALMDVAFAAGAEGQSTTLLADLWSAPAATGLLVSSTDGGVHVTVRGTGAGLASGRSMGIADDGTVVVATEDLTGGMLTSADGGHSWHLASLPSPDRS